MSPKELHTLFSHISACSILLPFGAALIYFRTLPKALTVLAIFIFISVIADGYALYTASKGINNLPVLHIYTVLEFAFFSTVYMHLFHQKKIKLALIIIIILFSCFAFYHSFFIADVFKFNSVTRVVESLLLTSTGLYFLYTMLDSDDYVKLGTYPYFWITSGVLLYFMGNFFLFMLYEMINSYVSKSVNIEFWILHSILNIIANVLYCVGFACSPRLQK